MPVCSSLCQSLCPAHQAPPSSFSQSPTPSEGLGGYGMAHNPPPLPPSEWGLWNEHQRNHLANHKIASKYCVCACRASKSFPLLMCLLPSRASECVWVYMGGGGRGRTTKLGVIMYRYSKHTEMLQMSRDLSLAIKSKAYQLPVELQSYKMIM